MTRTKYVIGRRLNGRVEYRERRTHGWGARRRHAHRYSPRFIRQYRHLLRPMEFVQKVVVER